jgi:hypothetical protein
MGLIEKLYDFKSQSLQGIAFNLVKWFNFDEVKINTRQRDNVESRVWITVELEKDGKTTWIDGQRNDIVHRRLVEWLETNIKNPGNG